MVRFLSLADNLHGILRLLYTDMMDLCWPMTKVATAIAGIGALLYIAYRIWQSLARAEPIDLFPLLRPFAIGICILFFPTLVLGSLNGILSPLVQATHSLMAGQTLDMNAWQQECARMEQQNRERMPAESYYTEDEAMERELNELGLDDESKAAEEVDATDNPALRAAEANRAMQTQMRQFYAQPAHNTEVETLKKQVETLQAQLDAEQQRLDPLQLAEEQYKLARKYLGGTTGEEVEHAPADRRKNRLSVMRPVHEGDVEASTLNPEADFTRERNLGFLTAAGRTAETNVPTVQACIAATQVVRAGSMVHLRLLNAVRIDGVTIPRNTTIYGTAVIAGMRLHVEITSIEYEGHIFTVEAFAYDMDGQPGLNIPDSKERSALKEALASIGQTAGTSINVTHSTGQAVLSELARGSLQASSRYVSEKLREVKITLKANHRILLISKEQ